MTTFTSNFENIQGESKKRVNSEILHIIKQFFVITKKLLYYMQDLAIHPFIDSPFMQ